MALEVDDKSSNPTPVQAVHPVYAGHLDNTGAKPRFIITARALEDPSEAEIETETEHETTEYSSTDEETEEPMTEERTPSTESGLFTSTSAAAYTTELAPTAASDDEQESIVARTGEAAEADDASSVSSILDHVIVKLLILLCTIFCQVFA